jgi:hypothetical protein
MSPHVVGTRSVLISSLLSYLKFGLSCCWTRLAVTGEDLIQATSLCSTCSDGVSSDRGSVTDVSSSLWAIGESVAEVLRIGLLFFM